jgi:hypothetical protein
MARPFHPHEDSRGKNTTMVRFASLWNTLGARREERRLGSRRAPERHRGESVRRDPGHLVGQGGAKDVRRDLVDLAVRLDSPRPTVTLTSPSLRPRRSFTGRSNAEQTPPWELVTSAILYSPPVTPIAWKRTHLVLDARCHVRRAASPPPALDGGQVSAFVTPPHWARHRGTLESQRSLVEPSPSATGWPRRRRAAWCMCSRLPTPQSRSRLPT